MFVWWAFAKESWWTALFSYNNCCSRLYANEADLNYLMTKSKRLELGKLALLPKPVQQLVTITMNKVLPLRFLFSIIGKWNVFNMKYQAFLLYKIIISYTTKNMLVFGFKGRENRETKIRNIRIDAISAFRIRGRVLLVTPGLDGVLRELGTRECRSLAEQNW